MVFGEQKQRACIDAAERSEEHQHANDVLQFDYDQWYQELRCRRCKVCVVKLNISFLQTRKNDKNDINLNCSA